MMPPAKRLQAARWLFARASLAVGVPLRLRSPDRELLEKKILPYFAARKEFRKILFVGCDWDTKLYQRSFRDRAYTTIDVDPTRRAFGAKRHIVGSMARLKDHVSAGELDLILCNGVFGWGLDGRDEASKRSPLLTRRRAKTARSCSAGMTCRSIGRSTQRSSTSFAGSRVGPFRR